MNDDFLRADAERWNARQSRPPDLDAAIAQLAADVVPRGRRTLLGVLAASAVVAAAAAVVVISASLNERPTTHPTPAAAAPVHVVTSTVVATVTHTVDVLSAPTPPPRTNGALATVTITADVRVDASELVGKPAVAPTIHGSAAGTVEVQTAVVASTTAKPAFGHVRALLASLGMFVVIAGAWGIGREQRRRTH